MEHRYRRQRRQGRRERVARKGSFLIASLLESGNDDCALSSGRDRTLLGIGITTEEEVVWAEGRVWALDRHGWSPTKLACGIGADIVGG